jgi:poly [ADP-ribose] polymerase
MLLYLSCLICLIHSQSEEYKILETYFNATKNQSQNLEIVDIFKVDRHSEGARFKRHDNIQNRKLLWHGTNIAVIVAILSNGLRIMPHSGGRVGKGCMSIVNPVLFVSLSFYACCVK